MFFQCIILMEHMEIETDLKLSSTSFEGHYVMSKNVPISQLAIATLELVFQKIKTF